MNIQNIFYIAGITTFSLTSLLIIVLIVTTLGIKGKIRYFFDEVEEKMDGKLVSNLIQFIPVIAAMASEFVGYKLYNRKKKKK